MKLFLSAGRPGLTGKVVEKYTIDLDTILQILRGFQKSGTLSGELPARKLGNKVAWQAQLRLLDGEVVTCVVLNENGAAVRSGEDALKALQKAGNLNWTMMPDSEQTKRSPTVRLDRVSSIFPSDPRLPTPPRSDPRFPALPHSDPRLPVAPYWKTVGLPVARRLVLVTAEQMNLESWPRNYRQVYAMVDGVRTCEKIASLLSLRPEEVVYILRDLQMRQVLLFE